MHATKCERRAYKSFLDTSVPQHRHVPDPPSYYVNLQADILTSDTMRERQTQSLQVWAVLHPRDRSGDIFEYL